MKANAGTFGCGCLVLWLGSGRENGAVVVKLNNQQWAMEVYCNDCDVEHSGGQATVTFKSRSEQGPCIVLPPGAHLGDAMTAAARLDRIIRA